jgi:hypothetical protein
MLRNPDPEVGDRIRILKSVLGSRFGRLKMSNKISAKIAQIHNNARIGELVSLQRNN